MEIQDDLYFKLQGQSGQPRYRNNTLSYTFYISTTVQIMFDCKKPKFQFRKKPKSMDRAKRRKI